MSGPRWRGNTWQLHDSVPVDIVRRHKGTRITIQLAGMAREVTIGTQVKLSLRTSDRETARERYNSASAQLREAYHALRQAYAAGPVRLTDRQCSEFAGDYFRHVKAEHEANTGSAEAWDAAIGAAGDLGETDKGRESMHGTYADSLLMTRGITVGWESRERLLVAMHLAFLDAAKRVEKAAEGNWGPMASGEDQYPTPAMVTTLPQLTLADVRDKWIANHRSLGNSEKTARIFPTQFGTLVKFLGGDDQKDAASVTADDIEGWIAHLLAAGLSRKTIGAVYIPFVRAAFALSKRSLTIAPFADLKFKVGKTRTERSKGFTHSEAIAILRAAKGGIGVPARAYDNMKRTIRWVPWICAYTGARVGEILQLRKQDFKTEFGINFIQVTPEAGTTKTRNYRQVPLHPHLIEQGLLKLIDSLPDGPVFLPIASPDTDTTKVANRLRLWVRTVDGFNDLRVWPNHAWRHRFITEARGIEMDSETRDMLTGHEDGRASRGYGEAALKSLNAAIARFPRINIEP